MNWYLIEGINPEPWTAPELSVIRKGDKWIPIARKGEQSRQYQEAVHEALLEQVTAPPITDPVCLQLYFWRRLDSWETVGGREAHSHEADATNMQKATEDACQGVLFVNDSQVHDVGRSKIVEQGPHVDPPRILIGISPVPPVPARIMAKVEELHVEPPEPTDNLDRDFNVREVF